MCAAWCLQSKDSKDNQRIALYISISSNIYSDVYSDMVVHCDRLKLGPTAALDCQTGQNKGKYSKKELHKLPVYSCFTSFFLGLKFSTKYYNNKLKRLLGVKLHNKFKILCNND